MILKLTGRLSYIEAKKAHFVFDDDSSLEKLDRACPEADHARMHNRTGFYLPLKQDIGEFVGMDCIIRVRVTVYSLKSKYEANYGETVAGYRLSLVDIELDPKYQQG